MSDDPVAEQELLVRLGAAMTFAGESIDEVGERLRRIGKARGVDGLSVVVLPTALFVQTGSADTARVQFESYPNRHVRLDQISALYDIVDNAEDPTYAARDGIAAVDAVLAMPARRGRMLRTLGLGLLSLGFSLMLQPSPSGMAIAFALGVMVGLLQLLRAPGLAVVMPYLATFLVSCIVFATASTFDSDNPVRTLIPPLVIFLPGALMTTGMRDLAAGQVISGSGRLVQSVVILMMLAFSISAAATLVGAPNSTLLDIPAPKLGFWAPWLGVVVVAVGTYLHRSARLRAMPWIFAVMLVAYGAQAISARVFSSELSAFFGALAMAPVALWIERFRHAPPSLVTFLPAFWLLVPGAAGLIGVTEIIGTDSALGSQDFVDALSTVIEISFGILLGVAVFHAGRVGMQEAVKVIPTPDHVRRWGRHFKSEETTG